MTVKKPKKFGRRYPWSEWFAKDRVVLRKNKDFSGHTYTFVQQIRNTAAKPKYNVKVTCEVSADGNSITMTVIERGNYA